MFHSLLPKKPYFLGAKMSGFEITAIFLFLIGGLYKSPRKMIAIYTFSNFLFLFVYLDLALYMAAISIGLSTMRGIASLFLNDKQNKYSVVLITFCIVCLIAIEIDHYADFLILVAALAIGLSIIFRDNLIMFRTTTIISQILWIIHSCIFGVYGMMICASIILCTSLWVLIKHTDIEAIRLEFISIAKRLKTEEA